MTPEYLFEIHGLGAGRSMDCVTVHQYKIKRETPKFWIVWQRGAEQRKDKKTYNLHTEAEVESKLRNEKRRRLEAAKRLVETLEKPCTITIHRIPEQQPPTFPGSIEL